MKIKPTVEREIARFEPGKLFSYSDLPVYTSSPETTIKAISRLVKSGEIKRFAKGQFYRPRKSQFGEIQLSDAEKLKAFMYRGSELTGYVTGIRLYNRLGLTTQVPRTITIAGDKSPQRKDLGTVEVKLVKARVPVSESNRELLEILDVLSDLKKIPDSDPSTSLKIVSALLEKFDKSEFAELVNLANYYPPVTRALLGILTDSKNKALTTILKRKLNPTTRYKVGLDSYWSNAKEWNVE